MKDYVRKILLVITFIGFSLLLLLYLNQAINNKSTLQSKVVSKIYSGLPVRLIIPTLNINVAIQYVGITSKGEMDVPNNTTDVGWFKLGPRPGEIGSAVIAGHFDKENGKAGVFFNLDKLKKGDKLYVTNDRKISVAFIVREIRIYDPGYADDVFSLNDKAHLNLITCDGVWDKTKQSFNKRLVVFTDIVQ